MGFTTISRIVCTGGLSDEGGWFRYVYDATGVAEGPGRVTNQRQEKLADRRNRLPHLLASKHWVYPALMGSRSPISLCRMKSAIK
jgi:hypothetical protein